MEAKLINQIEKELEENPRSKATFVFENGEMIKVRLFRSSSGDPCVFEKGRKRYGQRIYFGNYRNITEVIFAKEKSMRSQWEKSLIRARNILEQSGLWEELLEDINTALAIGFDKLLESEKIMDKRRDAVSYDENYRLNLRDLEAYEPRLVKVVSENKSANLTILRYLIRPLKIKKMNFGSLNKEKLDRVKEAFRQKIRITETGIKSYDITFEYSPEKNKAWYSEEYRNCGNGHYYLALSETHAVFWEDD